MKIIRSPEEMQKEVKVLKKKGSSVGLVPTMGALHEGHLSLVNRARAENDVVAVSIFVNPAQFGPKEDYLRYPRPFAKDSALCRKAGVDIIFAPSVNAMYPEGYRTYIKVDMMSDMLCGKFRPGHFRGVTTVVAKLFNIISPDRAYFGQKDFQQVRIIERMASDLNFPVKIVRCPIIRESSGLARSSRNSYLSDGERNAAARINEALQRASYLIKYSKSKNSGKIINNLRRSISGIPDSSIDYIEACDPETLVQKKRLDLPVAVLCAVWVGKTRLIDNVIVQ